MRAFQQVVELGSFAAAARAMDVSPAVITRLVADLEQSLGTRLLHRTTRKLSLTEAGNEYGARLQTILQEIDEAEIAASAHSKELHGNVRLIASPALAIFFLAPKLALWHRRHPRLVLDITVEMEALNRLEEFDLALIPADEKFDANVVARPLSKRHLILCAAPSYLQRVGVPRHPHDLQHHAYLGPRNLPGQDASSRSLRLEPFGTTPEPAMPIDIPIHTILRSNIHVLLPAALEGIGFLAISDLIARPYIKRGELVQLLPEWSLGQVTIYAAVSSRKFMPAKTRALIEFLVELASEHPDEASPGPAHGASGPAP